jgi:hypothetical protein
MSFHFEIICYGYLRQQLMTGLKLKLGLRPKYLSIVQKQRNVTITLFYPVHLYNPLNPVQKHI